VPSSYASGYYVETSEYCTTTIGAHVDSGTVTLSRSAPPSLQGSFDVTLDSGEHLTGTFDAPICDISDAGGTQAPPGSCGP
jgi:hypothetical protein